MCVSAALHAARTGSTCPSEVRHARWKIPLKHLQNNSTVSPSSSLFHTIFDLSNPRLLLFLIHLPVPASLRHHPHADSVSFHRNWIQRLLYSQRDWLQCLSFFFSLLLLLLSSPGKCHSQRRRGEKKQEEAEEGEVERSLFWIVSSSRLWPGAALLESPRCSSSFQFALSVWDQKILETILWISILSFKRPVSPWKYISDKSRHVICCSEASWGFSWLEMIEWHP